jgi:signal transduction histidine kinase
VYQSRTSLGQSSDEFTGDSTPLPREPSVRAWRPPAPRPLRSALLMLLAAGILITVLTIALLPPLTAENWASILFPLAALCYLLGGVIALHRRPGNGIGQILLLGFLALIISALGNTEIALFEAAGTLFATLTLAVLVHLVLTFPSGRVSDPVTRRIVIGAYLVSLVLQVPLYLFSDGPLASPLLFDVGNWAQRIAGFAVLLAASMVLLRRLRTVPTEHRVVISTVYGYAVFVMLFVPFGPAVLFDLMGMPHPTVAALQIVAIAGVPLAFVIGIMRGGFLPTVNADELAVWLSTPAGAAGGVHDALQRALGDPTLSLGYWIPARGAYLDRAGAPVEIPEADDPYRASWTVRAQGAAVAVILYNRQLLPDEDAVEAIARVAALALERERLVAELEIRESALRRSRERLVEAAERERRRIARDLHDGIQGRLVLLALDAQRLAKELGDAEQVARAVALRQGIEAASDEMRGLVHGVMPSPLLEGGLVLATEDLVDRMPIPTELSLHGVYGPLPDSVSSAAYFVVAEALANTLKHAQAESARVELRLEGGALHVIVSDDGIGLAPGDFAHGAVGTGLTGLADRVDVVDGAFALSATQPSGTTITVSIPCAS